MSSLSLAGRINRYYKLTPTPFFTSAAAHREKYGGGGVHKFRLARRRAEFFPAAAARHAPGWRRRWNSAAEGSTTVVTMMLWHCLSQQASTSCMHSSTQLQTSPSGRSAGTSLISSLSTFVWVCLTTHGFSLLSTGTMRSLLSVSFYCSYLCFIDLMINYFDLSICWFIDSFIHTFMHSFISWLSQWVREFFLVNYVFIYLFIFVYLLIK